MKKSLFLILTILSLFIFTDNVNALNFNLNGKETQVNTDNALDYLYSLAPDIFDLDIKDYLIFYDTTGSKPNLINFIYSSNDKCFYTTNSAQNEITPTFPHLLTSTVNIVFNANCIYSWVRVNHQGEFITYKDNYSSSLAYSDSFGSGNALLYSDIGIYSYPSITFNDLKQKINNSPIIYTITYYINNEVYKTIEVEEGTSHDLLTYDFNKGTHNFSGWTYDDTVDLTNITSDITITATLMEKDVIPVYIDFPITKTEFYALLVEVGILIMFLFLKWCFPFKGGSDLK